MVEWTKTTLAERIRFLRERADMSQAELARAIKRSPGLIWQIENGRNKEVRGATLLAIAGVFNSNPDWITNGVGTPYRIQSKDAMRSAITEKLEDLSPEHCAAVNAFIDAIKAVK